MAGSELTAPLVFQPLFMERIWGGRCLETLYRKPLPPLTKIGEAWEVVDRPEAQSVVREGPLRGRTLHELWAEHRAEVFGSVADAPRFPLLKKSFKTWKATLRSNSPFKTRLSSKGIPLAASADL